MGKSANFSKLEKETVLELVEKEMHIIEDKQNDDRKVAKKETRGLWQSCAQLNKPCAIWNEVKVTKLFLISLS